MKKFIWILTIVFGLGTLSAQQVENQKPADKTGISASELQNRINESVNNDLNKEVSEETRQAVAILKETQEVVSLIAQKKKDKAEEKLAEVIGKLEILLAKNPDLALIPVNATVEVHESVVDIQTVRSIMESVKKAIDKGYYQEAKRILNDLSSEIVVKTAYLPMATYPDAMKLAAKFLDENKNTEAAGVIVQALTTLVVREDIIPLPVLRAQEYIKEALKVLDNKKAFKENKEVITALLNAADYQLKLAEAMGYGKKDKEYKELAQSIDDLKKWVEKEKERKTKKALKALDDKLKKFKERLFPVQSKK